MYHRFCDTVHDDLRHVNRATLELQASYLLGHHASWDPDQHASIVRGERWPGGNCPVVITVDDGYADFASVAWPIFRKYGLRVMVFVTTGFVDGKTWFWWDRIEYILNEADSDFVSIELSGTTLEFSLGNPLSCRDAWHRIADHCRFLPDSLKESVIEDLARQLDVSVPLHPPPQYASVTWQQVIELAATGVQFGAHTQRHPILSRISLEEADEEIRCSQERLSEMLGRHIPRFCYPQGGPADWTPQIRQLVARRFSGSYLAYPASSESDDCYTIPRYSISRDMVSFKWIMCGAAYLNLRLRRMLKLPIGAGASYWSGHESSETRDSHSSQNARIEESSRPGAVAE